MSEVRIGKEIEICHVKNTGRCRELLTPGASLYLQKAESIKRKTKYDLISVYKGNTLINIDSLAPNKIVNEWMEEGKLFEKIDLIKPEYKIGKSRFDFYVESNGRKNIIEVKGVTLEENGVALFPDAPTERGLKHVTELSWLAREGLNSYLFFAVQMKGVKYFTPNFETHSAFGTALKQAKEWGVNILCYDCIVTPTEIKIDTPVPIVL